MRTSAVVVMLCGAVTGAVAALAWGWARVRARRGRVAVEAEVVAVHGGAGAWPRWRPTVRFVDRCGVLRVVDSGHEAPTRAWRPGERLRVWYDPGAPYRAFADPRQGVSGGAVAAVGLLGAVLAVCGALGSLVG